MLFYQHDIENVYRLAVWKTGEDEQTLRSLTGIHDTIPFSGTSRRMEFLSVRAAALTLGVNPEQIEYLPSGKPILIGRPEHISISHTNGYAVVMISNLPYIGTDIEIRSERVRKIRKRFLHSKEELLLKPFEGETETSGLLLFWCAKESLFKAIPDEGVDFIQELRIENCPLMNQSGRLEGIALRSNLRFNIDYRIEDDFVLTCCFSTESR
jgi:4'-phosphopantetheinyl transferase